VHATERRKKIKELYGKPIIPVIHLRLDSVIDEKSSIKEQGMKNWIVAIIEKNPFFVEIDMPEKEAEPLFPIEKHRAAD